MNDKSSHDVVNHDVHLIRTLLPVFCWLVVCLFCSLVVAQETVLPHVESTTEAVQESSQESLPLHVETQKQEEFCLEPETIGSFSEAIAGVIPKCYRGNYIHLDQRFGEGVGFDNSFATVGYFQPFWLPQGVFFADFLGTLDYNSRDRGSGGGNVGLGYRHYGLQRNRIYGVSLWYDLDNSYAATHQQIGVSLESIGDRWNFFINGYFPFDKSSRFGERAATGVDFEAGRRVSNWNLWVYGGFYHYSATGGSNTTGSSVRLNSRVGKSLLLDLQVTDDTVFDTNVIFSISWLLGKKGAPKSPAQQRAYLSLLQQVHRNQNVTVFR